VKADSAYHDLCPVARACGGLIYALFIFVRR
jgi:hypothetical protein